MATRATPLAVAALLLCGIPATALAQESDDATLRNALSAAPASIAAGAAVADWDGNVLREGSNGYTCLPDNPETPGNSPMCLDAGWLAWAQAWMGRSDPPPVAAMSFGYMLQGDSPVSNVDPYATEPADGNEWIRDGGPHVMVLVPDVSMLAGVSTDPDHGGPWVMWRDTPYVHLMIPVTKRE